MAKLAPKEDEHVHKLQRHKYANGTKVYFCVLNCNYKIEVAFALGKLSVCHICGNEFTMNEYSCKLAKPHCQNCGKFKVTDDTGQSRFISKGRSTAAIADMGKQAVGNLKDRLGKVVQIMQDEDI